MTERRQIVIGICAVSWSLLVLSILLSLFSAFVDSGSMSSPVRSWMSWPAVVIGIGQPALIGIGFLIVSVFAFASTAELVIARWGVEQEGHGESN